MRDKLAFLMNRTIPIARCIGAILYRQAIEFSFSKKSNCIFFSNKSETDFIIIVYGAFIALYIPEINCRLLSVGAKCECLKIYVYERLRILSTLLLGVYRQSLEWKHDGTAIA